jgi:hypothetical protein
MDLSAVGWMGGRGVDLSVEAEGPNQEPAAGRIATSGAVRDSRIGILWGK